MFKITHPDNLGKVIGITGLEKPRGPSTTEKYLCNICVQPIAKGHTYIRGISKNKLKYYYHNDCIFNAVITGKVNFVSTKRMLHIKAWHEHQVQLNYEENSKISSQRLL